VAEPDRAGAPERAVTMEMVTAAYAVLEKYGVRDVLEIDSEIMREMLAAALNLAETAHGSGPGDETIHTRR
jgi:hypothetical protein